MQFILSYMVKQGNHFTGFMRGFNSWSLAIKNAASPSKALTIYSQMQRQSIPLDSYSILFTLKSCTHLKDITVIQHLHTHILKLGFNTHVYVGTSLLNGYVRTSFEAACHLFDEMPERNTVTWNTMITCLSRSGYVEKAWLLFEQMPERDLASWSAMITAYMNNGCWDKGLVLFREIMVSEKLKPDQVTLGSVLVGCGLVGLAGLVLGKSAHGYALKNGWEMNVELGTVLVDMYAKCGFLKYAHVVFDMMQKKNVVSWTALICGYAQHGYGEEALSMFGMMEGMGMRPNELTFTGVLSACAQAGLVEEGQRFFGMIEEYDLRPRIQHYGCVVDLLGKAGLLGEAYEFISAMPMEPNVVVWGSFLSSCKVHKQFEMAERVFDRVLRMVRPDCNGGIYTLICDLYVLADKWDEAESIRKLMVNKNVRKARGSSFIRSGTA